MHKKTGLYSLYTLLHLIVDFSTIYLICRVLLGPDIGMIQRAEVIIVYNLVAFAGQLPLGIIADAIGKNPMFVFIGCMLAFASYPLALVSPWTACVLASVGNGAFHIGAGCEILKMSMPKASIAGIFVSSGAMGVWLAYNVQGDVFSKLLPVLLIVSCVVLKFVPKDVEENSQRNTSPYSVPGLTTCLASGCFLITVVIRSFLGMIMDFSWKALPIWSFLCVLAIVGGKAVGGIMADRFGYVKTSVISLLVSLIAFPFSFEIPFCAIVGIFCFNMTMPLTLTALARMCNQKYGFAFGLTTFALALGFIPVVFGGSSLFGLPLVETAVTVSLVLLISGYKCRGIK